MNAVLKEIDSDTQGQGEPLLPPFGTMQYQTSFMGEQNDQDFLNMQMNQDYYNKRTNFMEVDNGFTENQIFNIANGYEDNVRGLGSPKGMRSLSPA